MNGNNNSNVIYNSTDNHYGIIYNSHNSTLTFDKSVLSRASFVLNRTKINSRIYLINTEQNKKIYVSAPGELIDVTIAKINDDALVHIYTDDTINQSITQYQFDGVACYGYSFDYLIYDLEKMLFPDTQDRPWRDKKAIKRINRLFMVYFIKTSQTNVTDLQKTLENIDKFIKNIIVYIESLLNPRNIKDNDCAVTVDNVLVWNEQEIQKLGNVGLFKKICDIIGESLNKIAIYICSYIKNDVVEDKINEVIEIRNFLNNIQQNTTMLKIYCDALIYINIQQVEKPNIYIEKNLLGGKLKVNTDYKYKYEKYKKKYILKKYTNT